VREVVRLQAEHQQAVQQRDTLQQQTTQLTAERTALLEEQAQLRQQLQGTRSGCENSVAERSSFSFWDRVQMCVKPMAQLILGRSR
jgi:predicted  nucleic acid-binding Zn-ribbon protein